MALNTLAYAKHLEEAGVERRQTEAHAEAANHYIVADLATRADVERGFASQNQELANAVTNLRSKFAISLHQAELRILGVTFAMLSLLFVLIKLT
jgi:hypothetical protein